MCACVYIYMCVYIHVCLCSYMHVFVFMLTCVCICMCPCFSMSLFRNPRVCVHMPVCVYMCRYVCVCTCEGLTRTCRCLTRFSTWLWGSCAASMALSSPLVAGPTTVCSRTYFFLRNGIKTAWRTLIYLSMGLTGRTRKWLGSSILGFGVCGSSSPSSS